jgi:hypothetical protein
MFMAYAGRPLIKRKKGVKVRLSAIKNRPVRKMCCPWKIIICKYKSKVEARGGLPMLRCYIWWMVEVLFN